MTFQRFVFGLALFTAPALAAAGAPTLRFDHVPLGNVVRVISARFGVPVTVYAHATVPVSGNFESLPVDQALAAAAQQAGLEAKALGAQPSDGYELRLPPVVDKTAVLAAAARRREELLKQRAMLEAATPAQAAPRNAD